jgi:hypothetical protein
MRLVEFIVVILVSHRLYSIRQQHLTMPGTLEAEPTPLFPEAGPSNAHLRPHLVEIIPEEQLRSVLHPVFRYVLTVSDGDSKPGDRDLDLLRSGV